MPVRESRFACPCAAAGEDGAKSRLGLYAVRTLAVAAVFVAGMYATLVLDKTPLVCTATDAYPPPCVLAEMQDSLAQLGCNNHVLILPSQRLGREYVRALEYGPRVDVRGSETAWECTSHPVHTDCLVDVLCDPSVQRRANDLTCALIRARPFAMNLHDCVGRGRIGCDDVTIRALGPVVPSGFAWPADTECTPGLPRIDRLVSRAIGRRLRCTDDANATVTCAAVDDLRVAWRVVARRTK